VAIATPAKTQPIASPTAWPVESLWEVSDADADAVVVDVSRLADDST